MKRLFKKTWFQVIFFGIIIGAILIVADNNFDFFTKDNKKEGEYEGPIDMNKKDLYITSLKFDSPVHDFGKVKEGDTLLHYFMVKNTGKEPLFIYKIKGSCDCIVAYFGNDYLPPGKQDTVRVYFSTKGRKGPQTKPVIVTANTDPSETTLTLKADVQ